MASFKQPWPGATSPVHILLIALLVCEASSLLLQPAEARALDSDRKLLAQPDKVDNKNTEKIATTKELGDVRGSYWGGSGSGYNGGGGHWNGGGGYNGGGGHWNGGGGYNGGGGHWNGGGGYNGGGGHWNGGGGHWGGGGGGYHRGGGGCPYNGCRGGGWNQGVNKTP